MKKIILFSILAVVIILSAGMIYLNNVILPTKVKSWIVSSISEQTQRKVTLDSVSINLLRGLTLKNLTIYDESKAVISVKEASCGFFIFPMLQKRLIIPFVDIRSPAVFLERLPDNSFNLQKLIAVPKAETKDSKNSGFIVSVYKISVTNANVYFQDDTFPQPFKKEFRKLNLALNLSLPSSVKFKLTGSSYPQPGAVFRAIGEYKIPGQEFLAKINMDDFLPAEVEPYYRNSGLTIPKGKISSDLDLQYKNKQLVYSGKLKITDCRLEGLQFAKVIDNISGDVVFDNAGLSSQNLNATLANLPFQANVKLSDYASPKFTINIPQLNLKNLPVLLNYEFGFIPPGHSDGAASFTMDARRLPNTDKWEISGHVDIADALISMDKLPWPLEKLNGRINFYPGLMEWEGLNFNINAVNYTSVGSWSDFKTPHIKLALVSKELKLNTDFTVDDKLIDFKEFSGGYLNSTFSANGRLNTQNPKSVFADITGKVDADLEDLKSVFKKDREKFDKAGLKGRARADFVLNGRLDDIKNCALQAKASSSMISAYGLKSENLSFDYVQNEGAGSISSINMAFYGGLIRGTAGMNFSSSNFPYRLDLDMDRVRIEQLKLDTPLKNEDIAGSIHSNIKLTGALNDISRLTGSGDIVISEGRLWELNLFKGMGKLLFVRDFTSIIFKYGSCSFMVADNSISTDNLVLKSDITDLDGKVKIGFDSAINARLNVHILSESVPLTGTFKDIATAIIGQAGRFGVIKITGTIKEPKHSFEPAVGDILKGLTDVLMGK
ncbi:MAG: AsmA family protein [Candidatus Omnitrophica bacterium]|nr:AsmA family protein [Candidatus Omnitrophota bacterium]